MRIRKTYNFILGFLSINDGRVKNILQHIKQFKQRQHRKKNVNLFIISAPFGLLLGIQSRIKSFVFQLMLFEISKNYLGKSSVTHILLAEEHVTKKSKNIKH